MVLRVHESACCKVVTNVPRGEKHCVVVADLPEAEHH